MWHLFEVQLSCSCCLTYIHSSYDEIFRLKVLATRFISPGSSPYYLTLGPVHWSFCTTRSLSTQSDRCGFNTNSHRDNRPDIETLRPRNCITWNFLVYGVISILQRHEWIMLSTWDCSWPRTIPRISNFLHVWKVVKAFEGMVVSAHWKYGQRFIASRNLRPFVPVCSIHMQPLTSQPPRLIFMLKRVQSSPKCVRT